MAKDIKRIVNAITKEYNTRNPFDLAEHLGIYVHKNNDLGTVSGYYLTTSGKEKIIMLNSHLGDTSLGIFKVSQLLGHAILHGDEVAYLPKNEVEIEAYEFAVELLGADNQDSTNIAGQ